MLLYFSKTAWKQAFDLLQKVSVPVKETARLEGETCGVYEKAVSLFSYAGPSVHKVQNPAFVEKMLEICVPLNRRGLTADGEPNFADPNFDVNCYEHYNKSVKVWDKYNQIWDLLNDRRTQHADLNHKADEVGVLAMHFLEFLSVNFGRTAHNYPHLLAAHVPDQIRRFQRYHVALLCTCILLDTHTTQGPLALPDAAQRARPPVSEVCWW
jgi:hypothetical protein